MIRDIATAIRLLTVVPVGTVEGMHPGRYFSLVGWVYAAVGLGIASGASALGMAEGLSALLTAALIVAAWAGLSGFLHWDGLADSADGFGVRGDAARRLEVMRGSTVGAFGVTAIVLVAALQVTALAVIVDSGSWWALGAAPVVGRWAAGVALSLRRPARETGLAARYASAGGSATLVWQTIPVLPLLVNSPATRVAVIASTVISLVAGLFLPGPFIRRFGGITGDVLGAVILLAETFVLLVGVIIRGLV
ncbi:MAG: adenosylcobinamide-GDP ribazoletransferase [Coriobacteriia bacterium]